MEDLIVANKLIKGSIVAISEIAMNMRVILEEEEIELDFRFSICCLVHDWIYWFYFAFDQGLGLFVPTFNEGKYFVEPFDGVEE